MKSLKKKILSILAVSVLMVSMVGCGLVEQTPESIENTVLAKVNGLEITQKDLNEESKSYMMRELKHLILMWSLRKSKKPLKRE